MPVAGIFSGDRLLTEDEPSAVELEEEVAVDLSSSSSIGRDSDTSDGDGDSGEGEVQSSCKGPLGTLDALEEGLPIKYASFPLDVFGFTFIFPSKLTSYI